MCVTLLCFTVAVLSLSTLHHETRVTTKMTYTCVHAAQILRVFPPDRLAGVGVRLLAAAAEGHGVVAQGVGGPGDPLAQPQDVLVHVKHTVVQQLVQDGCPNRKKSCINTTS